MRGVRGVRSAGYFTAARLRMWGSSLRMSPDPNVPGWADWFNTAFSSLLGNEHSSSEITRNSAKPLRTRSARCSTAADDANSAYESGSSA
jgi:hypothetical protein